MSCDVPGGIARNKNGTARRRRCMDLNELLDEETPRLYIGTKGFYKKHAYCQ